MKTKIAVFDFTGCEGCEFHLLSLNELLLDIFEDFEVVNWRLLKEGEPRDFDIAFIEGAITTDENVKLIKEIRETSKYVVAIGACAINGNVFAELTPKQRELIGPKIYDEHYQLKAKFVDPVSKYVKVDYNVPGCAPNLEIFKKLLEQFRSEKIESPIKEVTPPDYVSKIEGHGRLKINFVEHKSTFIVEESERLIEALVLDKPYGKAPFINARICGICPIAHNLASWKAIESSMGVKVTDETETMRELLLISQMVKSHLLHLFFLVMPDYEGLHGSIELSQKYPKEFEGMLGIKKVSEKSLEIICGSSAFPVFTTLGGFTKIPTLGDLLKLQTELIGVLPNAEHIVNLFGQYEYLDINTDTKFLTMDPLSETSYPLYRGELNINFKEQVVIGSTAKLGFLEDGSIVKVGAMARLNFFNDELTPTAKELFDQYCPNLHNPYHNNIAQSIEIVHFLETMDQLITKLTQIDLAKALAQKNLKSAASSKLGRGVVEAPRGTLIHETTVNESGKIISYNIIPPTQMNLPSLEKEAQVVVDHFKNSGSDDKRVRREIEKLIRAYDPCITCAVH